MPSVLVLGAGDMGSAVAHALHRAGLAVAIRDDADAMHPRRGMAFADALREGQAMLAGLRAVRQVDILGLRRAMAADSGVVPITVLPLDPVLAALPWNALVDARMRKRQAHVPDLRGAGRVSIGLGPGFVAGGNCDLAIETSWERLGAILRDGATLPLRGEPRAIAGVGRERAVYAPAAGPFRTDRRIGERVAAGDAVAAIGDVVLRAPLAGVLRGLAHDGAAVRAGAKVVEVDPRGDPGLCFGLGERPRAVAASVVALLAGDTVRA